ncbi:MAG: TIGR00303 family protein [Methanobrevibacter sp.]|nr:TIGR00303 family protein [Candidatus Methanovirga aequatorialis]
MLNGLETYGCTDLIESLKGKKPFFICTIATTATCKIPRISGAGANTELMIYTPAGDAEIMVHGKTLCCDVPKTVSDGISVPTPAMITKGVIELTDVPFLIANAGSEINPEVPYISINDEGGGDIRTGHAVIDPEKIFEDAKIIAKEISKSCDYLVIGESIPAGTTTALGVLTALGYDASFKVSGSSPENPHELKMDVVHEGISKSDIRIGDFSPFDAVKTVGDPMIPAVAGMVIGSEVPVILAGGTQMAAVCGFIRKLDSDFDFSNVCLGTTTYVARDETSDLVDLISQVGEITVNVVDPYFERSENEGLKNYLKGFVKEGVGAGGAILMALLLGYSIDDVREKIEEILELNG